MPPWTPERQAECQRTIEMIRRSAGPQAVALAEIATSSWVALLEARDLAVVAATRSELVTAVPPTAVRTGDLLVRNADDSFWSYRLIARSNLDSPPA